MPTSGHTASHSIARSPNAHLVPSASRLVQCHTMGQALGPGRPRFQEVRAPASRRRCESVADISLVAITVSVHSQSCVPDCHSPLRALETICLLLVEGVAVGPSARPVGGLQIHARASIGAPVRDEGAAHFAQTYTFRTVAVDNRAIIETGDCVWGLPGEPPPSSVRRPPRQPPRLPQEGAGVAGPLVLRHPRSPLPPARRRLAAGDAGAGDDQRRGQRRQSTTAQSLRRTQSRRRANGRFLGLTWVSGPFGRGVTSGNG